MPRLAKENQFQNVTELRSRARSFSDMALNTLVGIAGNEKAAEASRVAAAVHILDRGWGKPDQHIHTENEGIEIVIRQIIERRDVHVIDVQPERVEDESDAAALK